ncbi:2,4-dihydroxyhept-2-ene-1,7-dioic acid aldolase [Phlyctema vagabunda]|uniref:2,4-dihydroxyhept-2-ene-1,7-dioic acid aldolase n=1 Tax=Phlyctema vagabunda TaxID=108571 RepID=A0ABR4PC72_9HELO
MQLCRGTSTSVIRAVPRSLPTQNRTSLDLLRNRIFRRAIISCRTRDKMASAMQEANRLKNAMEKGPSMGVWQMIPGSNVSRTLARTGVDWVLVDCEHGNIDDAAMHEAVPAIAACGVSPIVRIPDNQGFMVKRALDAGAHGVLVPLLYTVEDAKKLVLSSKFPPQGQRGFGSPFPMERFNHKLGSSEYLSQANDAILTMVQIETKEALNSVDEIAKVPGIDVLFVGPFDLGNNIGHPIIDGKMHDDLHAAIAKVLKAANAAGKKAGIFCTSGEQAKQYADDGFHMISVATDMHVLPAGVLHSLSTAKGEGPGPKLSGPYGK